MRVLVACECSGVVRDAFRRRGHDAWSCDIKPGEGEFAQFHILGDARDAIAHFQWDMLIAHPVCRYLANSGVKHMYNGMTYEGGINVERWNAMCEAAQFFADMWNAPIERVCVENPIMHGMAKERIQKLCAVDPFANRQIIQPWMFGHLETKATGLSLRGLPRLVPTHDVYKEMMALPYAQRAKVHHMAPSADRTAKRSRTYDGIGAAMAAQWG